METSTPRVYGYRWVVLAVFAVINAVVQMQWLTFAPIAREARIFYGATALQIDFLSMLFMIVFLVVCMPASYIIDTYGIRVGIGIGAVLTGVFGLFKGVFADRYAMVVAAQVGLAVAQPFILNAATKLAMRWFPVHERATAVGIATLAQFVGIIGVMVATPMLIAGGGGEGDLIPFMLQIYGAVSVAGAVALLAFLRERPPTPPTARGGEGRVRMVEGVGLMFKNRNMRLLVLLFFIGLGMFNAISTCIDQICQIKGADHGTDRAGGRSDPYCRRGGGRDPAAAFRSGPKKKSISGSGHGLHDSRARGVDLPDRLCRPVGVGLCLRVFLSGGRGARGIPVRRGDQLSRARVGFPGPSDPGRTDFGNLFYRGHERCRDDSLYGFVCRHGPAERLSMPSTRRVAHDAW